MILCGFGFYDALKKRVYGNLKHTSNSQTQLQTGAGISGFHSRNVLLCGGNHISQRLLRQMIFVTQIADVLAELYTELVLGRAFSRQIAQIRLFLFNTLSASYGLKFGGILGFCLLSVPHKYQVMGCRKNIFMKHCGGRKSAECVLPARNVAGK